MRKYRTISFDADQEAYDLWQQIKKHPKIHRGWHTKVLSRSFSNIVAGLGNGGSFEFFDEDLKLELEKFNEKHNAHKERRLKLLAQERIYLDAMQEAFAKTKIPFLYVEHMDDPEILPDLMDSFVTLIKAGTFVDSDYTLSPPMGVVRKFLDDTLEELEASGELNRLRCEKQTRDKENVGMAVELS